MPAGADEAPTGGLGDDGVSLTQVDGERFFHIDWLAGFERRQGLFGVERGGRADADHVAGLDQSRHICEPSDAVRLSHGQSPVAVDVEDAYELRVRLLGVLAGVIAAEDPCADDPGFQDDSHGRGRSMAPPRLATPALCR